MGKWARRVLIALGVIAVVGAGAYWWLIVESGAPSRSYAIDMSEVRRLADSMPGEKVREIHVEHIGDFAFPATAVVAGDGWDNAAMTVFSYELVFPRSTAIIDTALTEKDGKGGGISGTYHQDAYKRMSAALKSASLIVVTHEHLDHIGGLLAQANLRQLLTATKLNKEQLDNLARFAPNYPREAFNGYVPLTYEKYAAVAPGVVLIRAPGHTPGSQLVYVKEASGEEYLFLGDVAWHQRNIDIVRERARLVTLMLGEDRDAVLSQLAALNALKQKEPQIHLVPGHDPNAIAQLEKAGLLIKGFR
jgi:glyoxylase-like metal-dependent hydrolase (beta-lactamase superfamily II)